MLQLIVLSKRILIISSIILFSIFIIFSFLVAKEQFSQFDFDTTVRLQDHLPRKFDFPFSTLSLMGTAEITGLFWLGLTFLMFVKKQWKTVVSLCLFLVIIPIELFGKLFVFHPGPPFLFFRGVVEINFPSQYLHTDYSYPSGHMSRTSFLVSFLIILLMKKTTGILSIALRIGLIILTLAMAISRVYLGEHWTTDVIGGTLVGSSLGLLASLTIPIRKRLDKVSIKNLNSLQ